MSRVVHEAGGNAACSKRDGQGEKRAYNHAMLLPERRALMQQWADALDELKAGGKIIQIRSAVTLMGGSASVG